MNAILSDAIAKADAKYRGGEFQACLEVYIQAVDEVIALDDTLEMQLKEVLKKVKEETDPKVGISILRFAFDSIVILDTTATTPSSPASSAGEVERLDQLIRRTIEEGSLLYNGGQQKECYELYFDSIKHACMQEKIANSKVGQTLERALEEASPVAEAGQYAESAWILRRCFDELLESHAQWSSRSSRRGSMNFFPKEDLLEASSTSSTSPVSDISSDTGYWQDEMMENETDFEIATCLAEYTHILKSTVKPQTHTRFAAGIAFPHSFQGSDVVDVLIDLGLVKDRAIATMKSNMLLAGAFLIALTTSVNSIEFRDGTTHLYRFGHEKEMSDALQKLGANVPYAEGTQEAQLVIALQITLGVPTAHDANVTLTSHLKLDVEHLTTEEKKGVQLAKMAQKIEKIVDIDDRLHLLKTYPQCFVGRDAVQKLVQEQACSTRDEAIALMTSLFEADLVYHVSQDHGFKDKHLFYRFVSTSALRKSLEAFAVQPTRVIGQDLTRRAAAVTLHQQRVGDLSVQDVLNSFFAAKDMEGWDLVDLQNWRNNMKRWGFGRREDQDDTMVEHLAPLALTVDDPNAWFESLSDKEKQEWTSPWGILAQIAIFDQVPRSAFRGTPEAFKWDDLAIKASKLAIERGYFDSAYMSTLNQFLILLPLEHSEDWEDQKLGVTLILQLLSKVAVKDDGLSDYEIVKRMEFSKRLSTAFLEHAQVIAKFKRYPHRNKPLSRNTTLEERIWLASDLVPRWAKSQNSDNTRQNVVHLPVIPLKKLTRR